MTEGLALRPWPIPPAATDRELLANAAVACAVEEGDPELLRPADLYTISQKPAVGRYPLTLLVGPEQDLGLTARHGRQGSCPLSL